MRTAAELCDAADEAEQRLASSDSSVQTREAILQKARLPGRGGTISPRAFFSVSLRVFRCSGRENS